MSPWFSGAVSSSPCEERGRGDGEKIAMGEWRGEAPMGEREIGWGSSEKNVPTARTFVVG